MILGRTLQTTASTGFIEQGAAHPKARRSSLSSNYLAAFIEPIPQIGHAIAKSAGR
jgi:hypothetical protein